MAGKNRIKLAREAFKPYHGQIYGAEALKNIVRVNLTADEYNVLSYLKAMRAIGILKEIEPFKFLIDVNASYIPEDRPIFDDIFEVKSEEVKNEGTGSSIQRSKEVLAMDEGHESGV